MINQRLDSHRPAVAASPSTIGRVSAEGRVLGAVGIFVAMLAVGMFIATFALFRISDGAVEATNREIQYATAMSAAALNAKAIANDERGYVLSGNEEFLDQIETRVPLAREAFAQAMEVSDDAQRARLVEILRQFEYWLSLVDDEIATFQAGNEEAAQAAAVGRTREVRHEYERMLTEASLIQSGVPRAQAVISSLTGWLLAVLLGYLVAATVLGLVVAAWAVAGLRSANGQHAGASGAAGVRPASRDPEVPGP